jgi:hypothetical protein
MLAVLKVAAVKENIYLLPWILYTNSLAAAVRAYAERQTPNPNPNQLLSLHNEVRPEPSRRAAGALACRIALAFSRCLVARKKYL